LKSVWIECKEGEGQGKEIIELLLSYLENFKTKEERGGEAKGTSSLFPFPFITSLFLPLQLAVA